MKRALENIPQAGRPPALPVFLDSSVPPFPRSSVPWWTTTVRLIVSVKKQKSKSITYADNTLWTDQLDELVLNGANTVALSIGLEVAQVTNMADLIGRSSMCLSVWVDCVRLISRATHLVFFNRCHSQWGPADVQPLVLSPNW